MRVHGTMTATTLTTLLAAGIMVVAINGREGQPQPTPTSSQAAEPSHQMVRPEDMTWRLSGPGFATAIVDGDPSKPGPFTMMLRLEDGAWIQPHWHNVEKRLIVIGGELLMGAGESVDASKTRPLPAGGLALVPAGMRHFEGAKGLTVVALTAVGPFQTTYVKSREP